MNACEADSAFYPVILAGGRGTRFWPLSRKRRAKQLLALDGTQTMIQQTVARLLPLAPAKSLWVITNDDLRPAILRQLRTLSPRQVVAEPAGRNTAPAMGLAAFLLLREDPDAVLGLFPSDHVIAEPDKFRAALRRGIEIAASGANIVVLGIRPTRAETGYGYIEAGAQAGDRVAARSPLYGEAGHRAGAAVCGAGNYFWNSGMFCGAPIQLPTPCASTCRKLQRYWNRLRPLMARANSPGLFVSFIPSATTSASITRSSNRAPRKAKRGAHLLFTIRFRME